MKFRAICIAALTFLLAAVTGSAQTVTVNYGAAQQTIRGFGGSTAWMPAMTTAQANTLYGTGNGQLGLTLLRVRIDPTSTTGGSNWYFLAVIWIVCS